MNKFKESKNIFPCTLRVKAIPEEDYDIFNLYADGNWYTYDDGDETDEPTIINNEDELNEAIDEFFDSPEMSADGDQVLIQQNDLVRSILNTGKGKIFVYDYDQVDVDEDDWRVDDWRERLAKKEPTAVLIMTAIPAQNLELSLEETYKKENKMSNKANIESKLAEAFVSTLKDMKKEGLFESVDSFDLDFNGKEITVKLNESVQDKIYESLNDLQPIVDAIKHKRYRNVAIDTKRDGTKYILMMRPGESIEIYKNTNNFKLIHYTYMNKQEVYTKSLDIDELISTIRDLYSYGYHPN